MQQNTNPIMIGPAQYLVIETDNYGQRYETSVPTFTLPENWVETAPNTYVWNESESEVTWVIEVIKLD